MYFDDDVGPYIPPDNIEATIQNGAKRHRKGKDVQRGVFVKEEIIPLQYKGPRTIEKLWENPDFKLKKGVCVSGKNRVIRTRPRFKRWKIEFTLEYDDSIIDEKELKTAVKDAGALVGLGDWIPKYGRFLVEFEN
jgi:hypothetical protein